MNTLNRPALALLLLSACAGGNVTPLIEEGTQTVESQVTGTHVIAPGGARAVSLYYSNIYGYAQLAVQVKQSAMKHVFPSYQPYWAKAYATMSKDLAGAAWVRFDMHYWRTREVKGERIDEYRLSGGAELPLREDKPVAFAIELEEGTMWMQKAGHNTITQRGGGIPLDGDVFEGTSEEFELGAVDLPREAPAVTTEPTTVAAVNDVRVIARVYPDYFNYVVAAVQVKQSAMKNVFAPAHAYWSKAFVRAAVPDRVDPTRAHWVRTELKYVRTLEINGEHVDEFVVRGAGLGTGIQLEPQNQLGLTFGVETRGGSLLLENIHAELALGTPGEELFVGDF